MSKKLLSLAALTVLFAAPAFAGELSPHSMTGEVNVTTPDISSHGVPAIIAIEPNRGAVTTTSTTTYTEEQSSGASTNHYRGYHGRDVVYTEEHVSPTRTSTSTTIIRNTDPLDEIPGVMSLEDEANLAASSTTYVE